MKVMVNILAFAMLFFASCTKEEPDMPTPASVKTMQLSIGNKIFTATLEDNSSAESFYALLPTTLEMNELNRNEKIQLPRNHPARQQHPSRNHQRWRHYALRGQLHSGVLRNFQVIVQLFANRTYK